MPTARPFAYNPGSPIAGTEQVGSLAVGTPTSGFTNNPQYWNGPDEELGYVIAQPVSGNTQPTQVPEDAITLSSTYKGGDITLSNGGSINDLIINPSGDDISLRSLKNTEVGKLRIRESTTDYELIFYKNKYFLL
jgi:hypothetical protein